MGNREDLLAGALACLKDRGWARTTVRDIATAAGVNHAAIGYHFGSRDALLTEAFMLAMEEWGDEVEKATAAGVDPDASPRERYEAFWREAIASFGRSRELWLATIEAGVQAEHTPKIKELVQMGMQMSRTGFASKLLGVPEETLDGQTARTVGSIQLALMSGLLMQWLIDPENAPSEQDIADGLVALAAHITNSPRA
ncbi:TetR/AcrR family transcriptional regulator [Fodinicola feengrottensis]|uniref:TetR/AcrR family transcriptional regulator n=1 Tax=Fodinicola feengrottensis TaxID=435914 RepID=A0ABP4TU55_9ACTN|nr:TetR/AcrR family transcriptional regulator [Fodinicola feengrottensis]